MSAHTLALLAGLFIVPVALLWCGHRLRRRPARVQRAFWGGFAGHCIAGVLAITWGMIPPESWTPGETTRGFLGLWGLLVFPLLGALVALALPAVLRARPRGR